MSLSWSRSGRQYGGTDATLVKDRVALIGDAAGLVDPMMGEGIFYAIRSANILAEEFASGIEKNPLAPFEGYQKRIRDKILIEMRLFGRAANAFYSAPRQFHRLLLAQPIIAGQALRVIAGELSFVDYYNRYRRNALVRSVSGVASNLLSKWLRR